MHILSDVSQRRIITNNYSFVQDEMNKYKKNDMGYMVEYEVIEENLYLLKLTNNRVGDHYPMKNRKTKKYNAAKEINDIRNKAEKKNLTIEVSFKGLDNIKNLIKVISDKCTEEGCINKYNNELLTALLGDKFEDEYCVLIPKRNAT
ncbi:hypothetical protein [uncultured Clostridium sp.]|uniref:hypothetical protein n=1 Tax=uncultured Clostridium sp. TaxID=59620 RepID=UPI00263797A7|nr:hypothetical protein [uncultured Clostridium sp.]